MQTDRLPSLDSRLRAMHMTMASSVGRLVSADTEAGWAGWGEHHAYRVRLSYRGRTMDVPFRKGVGHLGSPPQLTEVVSCLLSDITDATTFEEWADDYGLDSDSRSAEATYRAVVKQTDAFRKLIGDDELLNTLRYETERD